MDHYVIELDCGRPFPGCLVLGPFSSRREAISAAADQVRGDFVVTVSVEEEHTP